MWSFRLSLSVWLIAVSSCAENKKNGLDQAQVDAIFKDAKIQKEELSGLNDVTALDQEEAAYRINENPQIYLNTPDSGQVGGEDCLSTETNKISGEAGVNYIKFYKSGSVDPAFCNDGETTYTLYKYEILVILSCDNYDFSLFNGRSYQAFIKAIPDLCPGNGRQYHLFKFKSEISYKASSNATYHINNVLTSSTEDGGPCQLVAENGVITDDGCAQVSKISYDSTIEEPAKTPVTTKYVDYEKFLSKALKSNQGDKVSLFYTTGKLAVTLNNWTGEVQYKGSLINPVWTLSSGTQTLSETFVGIKQ